MKEVTARKRKLPEHYEELQRLLQSGDSLDTADLANRFGVSRRTIQRWIKAVSSIVCSAPEAPAIAGSIERAAGGDVTHMSKGSGRASSARSAAQSRVRLSATHPHELVRQPRIESVLSMKAAPATDKEWRALDYLNFLWSRHIARRDELIAMAKQRHADVSERTMERDIAGLIAEGWIEEIGSNPPSTCYRLGPLIASNPEFSSEEAARLLGYLELRMQTFPDRSALAGVYAKVARLARLCLGRASFADLVSDALIRSRYCIIQGRLPQVDIRETLMLYSVEMAISQRRKLRIIYLGKAGDMEIPAVITGASGARSTLPNDRHQLVDPLGVIYYWVLDAWYLVSEMHGGGKARNGDSYAGDLKVAGGETGDSRDEGDLTTDGRTEGDAGAGDHVGSYAAESDIADNEASDNLKLWRLDRIHSLSVTDIPYVYPEDFDLHRVFADRWGVQGGEKVHVKVRFYNDLNVINRMQRETAHRKNRKISELPDGSCIFEDDVAGLDEFRMWLREFGASAEVLEPAILRDTVYQSARKLLERYHI